MGADVSARPIAALPTSFAAGTVANHGCREHAARRCWTHDSVHGTVLISLRSQLRAHRRTAALTLAVLVLGFTALAAHSALMSSDVGSHMGNAAAICLTVGCALVIAVAGFAVGRVRHRPVWRVTAPLAPALVFIPATAGFLVRAGPPASVLQVFRL